VSLTRAPIEPLRRVLAAARAAGVRVIHTREVGLPDIPHCSPHRRMPMSLNKRGLKSRVDDVVGKRLAGIACLGTPGGAIYANERGYKRRGDDMAGVR